MLEDLTHRFFISVQRVLHGKLGFQVLLYCQIQQGIDRMLPLFLSDLGDGPAFQVLILFQMDIIDNCRIPLEHAHLALFAVTTCVWHEAPPSLVHIPPQGWAPGWVCQLGFALG